MWLNVSTLEREKENVMEIFQNENKCKQRKNRMGGCGKHGKPL